MIAGLGLDIVKVSRIERLLEKHGERFLCRVYTGAERTELLKKNNSPDSLAARFAAKEAAMKALGSGWGDGVGWRDVEILSGVSGRPELTLHGGAARIASEKRVCRAHLSISHDGGMASAVVILEAN
ncbi:holo-ACP synthase [bacterium]|nr:MAG: holo-ACP synthase [bacterium]